MRPVRAKALIINAFAPTGRFAFINPYTQGGALGYELIGLSARIIGFWIYPPTTFFVLNQYNWHLTHPWLCVYWAFSPLCLCLDATSFCYFPTPTKTQFQVQYLHFWPLKTVSWTSKTMFGSKFLSFVRAVQMLLIYSAICQCVKLMCNLRNSKRTAFRSKRVRFALQKGSFCNAKGVQS